MGNKVRILLVEDEALTAKLLERNLNLVGYEVCGVVSTGESAIQMAEDTSPDIVIMDILLPGKIDGIEAAEQIQKKLNIPVIFMTGYSTRDIWDRSRAIKPLAHLIKPVTPDDLMPIIDDFIARRDTGKATAA